MNRPPPEELLAVLGSIERLVAAGIVDDYRSGSSPDILLIQWSAPVRRLLEAGREPFLEPGFQRAWASGDPAAVRRWLADEAGPPSADGTPPA